MNEVRKSHITLNVNIPKVGFSHFGYTVVKEITYGADKSSKTINYCIRHGGKCILLNRKNLFNLYASIADLLHDEEEEADKVQMKE